MATAMHRGQNSALDPKVRLPQRISGDQEAALRLRLMQFLQTTLDLERVLELFYREVQDAVPLSALEFAGANGETLVSLGASGRHQCDYRLISEEEHLGAIRFSRQRRFAEEELALLESLIGLLVYPLRNALLYREALHSALRDGVTGAGNRVAMDTTLLREVQLAHRYEQPLSLLVIDIDHFKRINDQHGHSYGDKVLRAVAQTLEGVTRATDMTFRYGGEEFVVVLSNTDCAGAQVIGERVRQSIAEQLMTVEGVAVNATVSIGTSTLLGGDTVDDLFERGDRALYAAKAAGRNCLVASIDLTPVGDAT